MAQSREEKKDSFVRVLMKFSQLFISLLAVSIYPNVFLTPGDKNPELTTDVICSPTFRTGPYRNVFLSEKKKVFKDYRVPWEDHAKYEVDHLISIELGGSNDIKNLWPESYLPIPGAREKDKVENHLHKCVCQGKISLEQAQEMIVKDWFSLYSQIQDGVQCPGIE